MLRWRFLGDVAVGRDNNFNLIRMLAAFGVLVSHAFPLSRGPGTPQPLQETFGIELGSLCVFVFFGLSGFLIAQSYERSRSVVAWGVARALRIMPALIVVVLFSAFVLGPVFTTLPLGDYFSARETYTFVVKEASLLRRQWGLPGVFEETPFGHVVNGSIWTLSYEVLCYAMILGLGLLGAFRRPGVFPAALLVFLALYGLRAALGPLLAPPEPVDSFARLALPFLIGSALFFYRRFVPLSWPLAIGGFVLVFAIMGASGPTPLSQVVLTVALVYATFVAAYLPGGAVRRYNAIGDYSYGVYLYAWPVQQAMASLTGPVWPVVNMVIAAPIVLGCATLSWRFVEKPALDARRSVAAAIERFVRRVRLRLSPA